MNCREYNQTKTISKTSLKKETDRMKNSNPEKDTMIVNEESNKKLKKNKKKTIIENNDLDKEYLINSNHYSNMLEDIENEKHIVNEHFIQDCNSGHISRTTARKKENKPVLNTYINTSKVNCKKNRDKSRLNKELNSTCYDE